MTANKLYPVTIITARYGGAYEGAPWVAFHDYPDALDDAVGSDPDCEGFFHGSTEREAYAGPIGRGATPDEALGDLRSQCPGEY